MKAISNWLFDGIAYEIGETLINDAPIVDTLSWQGQQSEEGKFATREIQDLLFEMAMPWPIEVLRETVKPNLPWADKHFEERVGGFPLNPPPSAAEWPFAQAGHKDHTDVIGRFSHTYPERYWPKYAGSVGFPRGIRFETGDLWDVVNLLIRDPATRQAYLPIWFPEDSMAARSGERVPCTLGYHFMIRRGKISVTYLIRACDFLRHFRDDVYMTIRLAQWVREMLEVKAQISIDLGNLTMHVMSMHVFEKDMDIVKYNQTKMDQVMVERLLGSMG